MTQLLTLDMWKTSSGQYPDREHSLELTKEKLASAKVLIDSVNELLSRLGVPVVHVSSGFRTSAANAAAGGSAFSGHTRGMAVDLSDPRGELDALFNSNPQLLRQFGLFLENPKATPGWAHLDIIPRVDRPSRIFNP